MITDEISKELEPYGSKVVYVKTEVSMDPEAGPEVEELPIDSSLKSVLKALGINRLYQYQWRALKSIIEGRNVTIVSGTATGKTEAFMIPLVEKALKGERALIVYPTKALARDQVSRFSSLSGLVKVGIFDGDTPESERRRLYENPPQVIVTNPDMIHYGLPMSYRFRALIEGVRTTVFDEVHVYDGVLGSHLRALTERLKGILPGLQFVASTATVGRPELILPSLFGVEGEVILGNRFKKGMTLHALVRIGGISRWTLSVILSRALIRRGLKVLTFVDSQQMAELVAKIAKRMGLSILVHRAGIEVQERIQAEERLRRAEVDGVVATPTLELGMDIGSIDAVIMATNPPSFSKYIQRAGRAGRRGKPGLVLTLLGEDPLDSYFLRRPEEFFSRKPSPIYVDPANPEVIRVHLAAMVKERGRVKLSEVDPQWRKGALELERSGIIRVFNEVAYPTSELIKFLKSSSLRYSGPVVKVIHGKKVIGERELPVALYDLYPGAIYMNAGRTYRVSSLDLGSLRAEVERMSDDTDYYTKPLYDVEVVNMDVEQKSQYSGLEVGFGEIVIRHRIWGFVLRDAMKREGSGEMIQLRDPLVFVYPSKGFMIKYPTLPEFSMRDGIEAYHATEHILISAGRVVAGASLTDLAGVSYPSGHVFVYDSQVGGSGVSRLLFERLEEAHEVALDILSNCDCEDGCPKCIYSPYCGNNNMYLSRRKSLRLIRSLPQGTFQEGNRWGNPIV
jgi:DEAD/DEAH box helicase domain-containing protein